MYRICIFCSADLGSNDSLERFPVGRSLAFDGERGRLWAVCGKCARWNLAPLEERWEAIEDAERLFRDTRLRVQSENVGLAKLRDGTRLIRVGAALAGELAAWRYGETLARRRRRWLIRTVPLTVGGFGFIGAGLVAGMGALLAWQIAEAAVSGTAAAVRRRRVILDTRTEDGFRVRVQRRHFAQVRLAEQDAEAKPLVVRGADARMALGRAMVDVNARGAARRETDDALREIQSAGSAAEFLRTVARQRPLLNGRVAWPTELASEKKSGFLDRWPGRSPSPSVTRSRPKDSTPKFAFSPLALEMALHEETERRALHGELAMLEAMWRDAEEIAAIADRLPDVPAPEPPRLVNG